LAYLTTARVQMLEKFPHNTCLNLRLYWYIKRCRNWFRLDAAELKVNNLFFNKAKIHEYINCSIHHNLQNTILTGTGIIILPILFCWRAKVLWQSKHDQQEVIKNAV